MEFIICHKDMSTNDAIMHASLQPGEWQNHLYKAKEMINGKVRYIYDTAKAGAKSAIRSGVGAMQNRFNTQRLNARQNVLNTFGGQKNSSYVDRAKNTTRYKDAMSQLNAANKRHASATRIANYLDNGGSYKKVVGAAAKAAGKYALSKGKSLASKGMSLLKNKIKQYNSTKNRSKTSIYADAAGPSAPTRWQKEAMDIKKGATKIKSGLSKLARMQPKTKDPKETARQKTRNSNSKFLKKLKDITAAGNARYKR